MSIHCTWRCVTLFVSLATIGTANAADPPAIGPGDRLLAEYFQAETKRLADADLREIRTADDWRRERVRDRAELFDMLGLDPLPERTPLAPTITGRIERDDFTVEKLHFQSRPGLYVTGNLYLPKSAKPAADGRIARHPAVLYVCGHARVVKNGVAYGNKTAYQHHAVWFARHGYVCLVIDTLQLGEIEGLHHGTHNLGRWWWNSVGYTPAGVEAWNCVRALDYLETRPEVDATRLGVTGRSGGGAYSWWIAALDDRIRVAVPVAGIASLENHVVDGCVDGHCDCMYHLNALGWDFGRVAALVAPRPLLILNSDKDPIFPENGVRHVHAQARRIYDLLGAADKIGVEITVGGHLDTPELQAFAFRWFERHLKGASDPQLAQLDTATEKLFEPAELKVFDKLPADERNTRIDESFTTVAATPTVPQDVAAWTAERDRWLKSLRTSSFHGWPDDATAGDLAAQPAFATEADGVAFRAIDFASQAHVPLRLHLMHRAGVKPAELDLVVLNVLDETGWNEFVAMARGPFAKQFDGDLLPAADADAWTQQKKMFQAFRWGMAYVAPRGIGPNAWTADAKKRNQYARRFMLLGQSVDGMRTWDARRAIQALRGVEGYADVPLWLQGQRQAAGWTLYASLFEPGIKRLDLWQLARSHREGPTYLNVLRTLDVPQAVALAAERSQVRLYQPDDAGWDYPQQVAKALAWDAKRIQVRKLPMK